MGELSGCLVLIVVSADHLVHLLIQHLGDILGILERYAAYLISLFRVLEGEFMLPFSRLTLLHLEVRLPSGQQVVVDWAMDTMAC